MARLASFVVLALSLAASTSAFPAYASLGGLSQRDLDAIIPTLKPTKTKLPPPPLKYNGTKLVNDAAHPWMAPGPNDKRGPCPGLNTLASHGVSHLHYTCWVPDLDSVYSGCPVMVLHHPTTSSLPPWKVRKGCSPEYQSPSLTLNNL
jgi:hypothetical protein